MIKYCISAWARYEIIFIKEIQSASQAIDASAVPAALYFFQICFGLETFRNYELFCNSEGIIRRRETVMAILKKSHVYIFMLKCALCYVQGYN